MTTPTPMQKQTPMARRTKKTERGPRKGTRPVPLPHLQLLVLWTIKTKTLPAAQKWQRPRLRLSALAAPTPRNLQSGFCKTGPSGTASRALHAIATQLGEAQEKRLRRPPPGPEEQGPPIIVARLGRHHRGEAPLLRHQGGAGSEMPV